MLKPEQLRLGNYIYSEVTTVNVKVTTKVLKLMESEIKTKGVSRYKRIPLTKEIKTGITCLNEDVLIDNLGFVLFKNGYSYQFIFDDYCYLHQFQNLYFSLTGKELKVKL